LFLQTKDLQQYIKYKKLRADVRRLTIKIRRDDWDKSVKFLERDITGMQRRGFKIFKKLQLETNDQIQTNPISQEEWKKHYSKLWHSPGTQERNGDEDDTTAIINGEDITMEELDFILKNKEPKKSRNRHFECRTI
jgi:hypothetical protein